MSSWGIDYLRGDSEKVMTPSVGQILLGEKIQLTPATRILECGRARVLSDIGLVSIVSIIGREFIGDSGREFFKTASSMYSQRCPLLSMKFTASGVDNSHWFNS